MLDVFLSLLLLGILFGMVGFVWVKAMYPDFVEEEGDDER
jgi:hypothetical protein